MVLSQIISVDLTFVADNTDALATSQLAQPNVPGVFTVWLAAIAVDAEVTITLGGRSLITDGIIVQRANAEIRENEDGFYQGISMVGGRPIIAINIITATTVRLRVKFLPTVAG